jgi:hypothetical protein
MSTININIGEFICEPPIFNSVTYTGTRWIFELDWSSQGSFYSSFDPTTNLSLSIQIVEISSSIIVYSNEVDPSVPFNINNYQIDISDFYSGFNDKYRITFILNLTNEVGCNNSETYTVPDGTYL